MDCHAMRRLGQVEEVSKVVSFLASAKAAYTTGAIWSSSAEVVIVWRIVWIVSSLIIPSVHLKA